MPTVGYNYLSVPDRRVLMQPAEPEHEIVVVSDSTNTDASGPRSTMLRPGTILVADANKAIWYDDVSGGTNSAPATVSSLEAPDGDWASTTITLTIDGVAQASAALSGSAIDIATVVSELQAIEEFNAIATAADSGSGDLLVITLRENGKHLKVASDLSTAFGASGTSAFPTVADIVVTTEYCDQLDPMGTAADACAHGVRAGVFDESNLLFAGAAVSSSAYWPEFKRILTERGSRFE